MNSDNLRTSHNVGSVTDESGTVTNVGVAVAIGSLKSFRSIVISISGFWGRHCDFWYLVNVWQCRAMSNNVDSVISELAMAENMGVEVGIAAPSLIV